MKTFKKLLCFFIILLVVSLTAFPSFAVEESLLTLICKPSFETDDYDVIYVQLMNTTTGDTYEKKLYKFNNYSDKFFVEDGSFIIVEASVENRGDSIYQASSKSFVVSGNTIIDFSLKDTSYANKHTTSTTTLVFPKEEEQSIIIKVKNEKDIEQIVDMVKDPKRVTIDKINNKVIVDVRDLNNNQKILLSEILESKTDVVESVDYVNNEDLKTQTQTSQSVIANTSELSKSTTVSTTKTQQNNPEQHEKPWYIKHWYLSIALLFLLLMISVAIFVVHQRKKYAED